MRRILSCLSIVLALVATSCTGDTSRRPTPGGGTASVLPRTGGTLRVLLAEDVDALDPQRAAHPPAWGLLRAMHRGLMAFPAKPGPDGARPVPDLAKDEPTVAADGLRYEFRLRENVAFAAPASRPLRAADVKAGLERAISASSPIASYLRVIAGADAFAAKAAAGISGITTPNDRTVVITLARPVNDLLWLLALPAASAVPPGLPPVTSPYKIPSSGPYRLDEGGYRPEQSIRLVRNLSWNRDSDPVRGAWVDQISVEVGGDAKEIRRRLIAGEADLSGDVSPDGLAPGAVPAERLIRTPNGCLRYLFMNPAVAPFSNGRVRTAVARAVDRAAFAATYGGTAVAAGDLLPPTVEGHAISPVERGTPDPAGVKGALAAAGYPDGFATRLVVGNQAIDEANAGAVRRALAAAGVRVTVRTVPIASLYEDHYEVPAARVPMGIATWCADWPGRGGRGALSPLVDGRTLAARGNTNYSGVNDRRLNALLDAAALERNTSAITAGWQAASAEALGFATVVPLAYLSETSLLGQDVRGFVGHPHLVRGDLTALWLDRPS
ncbi:MAG: ABC transporter substrate-binding protein [Actinomycetota bacterium]